MQIKSITVMKFLTILIVSVTLAGCKRDVQQRQLPRPTPPPTDEQSYITVDYVQVSCARPIKDTTPGNFFTNVVFTEYLPAGSYLPFRPKGYYHYADSTSKYAYSVFFSSNHLTEYKVNFNAHGILSLTTKQMNAGEFFCAYNGHYLNWYRVAQDKDLTVEFTYGEATDSLNVDYIMKAFNYMINKPISERNYVDY
jgi:hypothetical protein